MADLIFNDNAGSQRAVWGDDVAYITPVTAGVHAAAQIPWTQTSVSNRPKVVRQPVTRVRNLVPSSTDLTAFGWSFVRLEDPALDGSTSADGGAYWQLIQEDPSVSGYLRAFVNVSAGDLVHWEGTVKTGTVDFVALAVAGGVGPNIISIFNTATGVWDVEDPEAEEHFVEDLGGGEYRIGLSGIAAGTGTWDLRVNGQLNIGTASAPGDYALFTRPQVTINEVGLTAFQEVFSAFDITETGVQSIACIEQDGATEELEMVIPNGITGRVVYCSPERGIYIEDGVTVAPGGTLLSGKVNGAGGTINLIPALGNRFWSILPLDGTRTNDEAILTSTARSLGLPGVLTAGAELLTNGGFATGDFTGWTVNDIGTPPSASTVNGSKQAVLTYTDNSNRGRIEQVGLSLSAGLYDLTVDLASGGGQFDLRNAAGSIVAFNNFTSAGVKTAILDVTETTVEFVVTSFGLGAVINSISVKKLTAGA